MAAAPNLAIAPNIKWAPQHKHKKMPGHKGPGKVDKAMLGYTKRPARRNTFSHLPKRKRPTPAGIVMVPRVGPRWITVGRRLRSIPVFFIKTRMLSARASI
jgi:hypothetical protein